MSVSKNSCLISILKLTFIFVYIVLVLASITTFLTQTVNAQTSLIGSIDVNDVLVSTSTTFNFDLVSTGETVAAYDYLQITIPDDYDS